MHGGQKQQAKTAHLHVLDLGTPWLRISASNEVLEYLVVSTGALGRHDMCTVFQGHGNKENEMVAIMQLAQQLNVGSR